MPAEPWYEQGLRFECTRCGNCCTGPSGTVLVAPEELAALAERLELARHEFRASYTRTLPSGAISLRERERADGRENAAETCPGIGTGPLYSAAAIEECVTDDGTLGTKPDLD